MKIPTLREIIDGISTWFGADPVIGRRVFFASVHTAWQTFSALLTGLTIDAYESGGREVFNSLGQPAGYLGARSPMEYLVYYHAHWMPWLIANVMTPGLRAWAESRRGTSSRATDKAAPPANQTP